MYDTAHRRVLDSLKVGLFAFVITCFPIESANAQIDSPSGENSIRILLFYDSADGVTPLQIEAARNSIENTWNNSGLPAYSGYSVKFANGGDALPIAGLSSAPPIAAATLESHVLATQPGNTRSLRDQYGADVVIGVASLQAGICGYADQDTWIFTRVLGSTNFSDMGDLVPDGLDRRGKDTNFVAVVSTDSSCPEEVVAAHEFGHLLGGGHIKGATATLDQYVTDEAHAFPRLTYYFIYDQVIFEVDRTALTSPQDDACNLGPHIGVNFCRWAAIYSHPSDGWGYADTNDNRNAFDLTAPSVAAYRIGAGLPATPQCSDGVDNDSDGLIDNGVDPGCTSAADDDESNGIPAPPPACDSTDAPHSYTGQLLDECFLLNGVWGTAYLLQWRHHCPSAVTYYEIMYRQPVTDPLESGWTKVIQESPAAVTGPAARSWVRSCGPAGCSGLSASSFLAVDTCN